MADLCKQCSIETFGEDFGDLANITTKENELQGYYAVFICEGCGFIQVDHKGNCVTSDCLYKHGETYAPTRIS